MLGTIVTYGSHTGRNIYMSILTASTMCATPTTPSTITPTSHKCQDCALAHQVPRPLRHQESVMCGSALPPADHERTNRPTRKFTYRAMAPDPDRRTAPPGASLLRFFDPPPPLEKRTTGCFARLRLQTQRRLVLLGEGTESIATNARSPELSFAPPPTPPRPHHHRRRDAGT